MGRTDEYRYALRYARAGISQDDSFDFLRIRRCTYPDEKLADIIKVAFGDYREAKEAKANANGAETTDLQSIASKKVRWIWQGRFPRGKLTVIDGDPGLGKSLLGCDFAARHSNGSDWPDGMPCPQGNTMLSTYADGLDDTVKPRLEAANADFLNGRLMVLTQIQDKQGNGYHLPSIPSDMQAIKAHCIKHKIELLVIDPFRAALYDQVDAWNDKKMRKAMAPLAAMAQQLGIAVIIIRHLNKKE